jgi:hypothetical protein
VISAPASASGGRDCKSTLGDAADGGQRLAAEAEGADLEQVVGIAQFARGVVAERQRQVVGVDAAAVIDDADQVGTALLDIDIDARAAGVNGVLQQFLDDAGRPFDDLARGDLVDDNGWQWLDTSHDGCSEHTSNTHSITACLWWPQPSRDAQIDAW